MLCHDTEGRAIVIIHCCCRDPFLLQTCRRVRSKYKLILDTKIEESVHCLLSLLEEKMSSNYVL